MRIAVYARVSTGHQDTKSQDFAVNEWLAKRETTSVIRFEDTQSGKDDDRPGLRALCAAIEAGTVDTVVTFRLDRISRRSVTALRLLLDWLNRGVGFVAVGQAALNLGLDNPLRLTIAAIFADLAQLEREALVSRVRAGLRAAKARGVKLGGVPKLSDEQAKVAKDLRAAGFTCVQVGSRLGVSAATISRLRRRA